MTIFGIDFSTVVFGLLRRVPQLPQTSPQIDLIRFYSLDPFQKTL